MATGRSRTWRTLTRQDFEPVGVMIYLSGRLGSRLAAVQVERARHRSTKRHGMLCARKDQEHTQRTLTPCEGLDQVTGGVRLRGRVVTRDRTSWKGSKTDADQGALDVDISVDGAPAIVRWGQLPGQ